MRSWVASGGILVALYGLATAPACAQRSLGAIVSSVRDAANRPVAGALVVASGPAVRDATTNSAGIVTLEGLPAGRYTLSVTHSGFLPYTQFVRVGSAAAEGVRVVSVTIAAQNFASASDAFAPAVAAPVDGRDAPFAVPALTDAVSADISATRSGPFTLAGPALEGASPNETRLEIDGIPLAGGARSAAALAGRSALVLADIAIVDGPNPATPSLRDAIGGIVDYRTRPISAQPAGGFAYGYDSVYGSYGHARYSDTFGKLGVGFDVAAGQNGDDAAVLKARLDLSRSTSVSLASYENRSSLTGPDGGTTDDAPASSAEVRTGVGGATLRARIYESRSLSVASGDSSGTQTWRTSGMTLDDAIPFGQNLVTLGYDRRVERYAESDGTGTRAVLDSVATLRVATEWQIARASRLEVGDDVSRGTALPYRNDPQIALAVHASDALALRFAAGGAYATEPLDLAAANPGYEPPETSFGYRAAADYATRDGDRVRLAAFALRRFATFAPLAQARSAGLEIGFDRTPQGGRVGVAAALALTRSVAFGAPQPAARYAAGATDVGFEATGSAEPGDAYARARLALAYDVEGVELRAGTTLLGANNALVSKAAALGYFSLRLPVDPIAVRIGVENAYGLIPANPALVPLYPPRELTLTLER